MSANERGLGRGLDAVPQRNACGAPVFGQVDSARCPRPVPSTTTLPIAALTPCKGQPNIIFDEAALDELAASSGARRHPAAAGASAPDGNGDHHNRGGRAPLAGRAAPGLPKCRFICGNCPMRTP